MSVYLEKKKHSFMYRVFSACLLCIFSVTMIVPPSYAQGLPAMMGLPSPTAMIGTTPLYVPALIKGIEIHPDNPLQFGFIIDSGHSKVSGRALEKEATRMVKYFLAALTIPEKELWVNLSPYEKDRIIPDAFSQTDMGMDLLAQDYILKQLTASLMYPEKELGAEFWRKVHKQVKERFGKTDFDFNTFNKIWIVPEKAVVFERDNQVFVVNSHLKVLMEEDYVALQNSQSQSREAAEPQSDARALENQIIREVIVPAIEEEVNYGKHFARLRQINNAAILAKWYKQSLKESLLGQVYVDQAKMKGIDTSTPQMKEEIYQQYIEAFKKGVYNYIKEDADPQTQEIIPRRYFSGGAGLAQKIKSVDSSMLNDPQIKGVVAKGVKPQGSVGRFDFTLVENEASTDKALLTDEALEQIDAINKKNKRFKIEYKVEQGRTVLVLRDTYKNSSLSVIPERGFSVTSFKINEWEDDVLFESPDIEKLRGLFLLGPWVNRLDVKRAKEAGFDVEKLMAGSPVFKDIKIDGDGNANHGVLRDMPWTVDHVEETEDGISVSAFVDFGDYAVLKEMFGNVVYHVTYTMEGSSLKLNYSIENKGETTAPAFFGAHPCLKVNVKNARVRMSARNVFQLNEHLRPQGSVPVQDAGFNFSSEQGASTNPEHNQWETPVFSDFLTSEGRYVVQIDDPSNRKAVYLDIDSKAFPYFVLWNTDKTGQVLGAEPMNIPADHHNQSLEMNPGVEPGQTVSGSFSIFVASEMDSASFKSALDRLEKIFPDNTYKPDRLYSRTAVGLFVDDMVLVSNTRYASLVKTTVVLGLLEFIKDAFVVNESKIEASKSVGKSSKLTFLGYCEVLHALTRIFNEDRIAAKNVVDYYGQDEIVEKFEAMMGVASYEEEEILRNFNDAFQQFIERHKSDADSADSSQLADDDAWKIYRQAHPDTKITDELVDQARGVGIVLTQADFEDMEDEYFRDVAKHIVGRAKAIGLHPKVADRLFHPVKVFEFEIAAVNKKGEHVTLKARRIRHNDARGAGKGGIRFHAATTRGTNRALATDMTWKTSISGVPYGGGKGSIQMNPNDFSIEEQERIVRTYVRKLLEIDVHAIGEFDDVPAPDVGSTGQHMAWMRDEYEKITGKEAPGMITGKPVLSEGDLWQGGSEGRTKATGYGVYIAIREAVETYAQRLGINSNMSELTYSIQGAGNVAWYTLESLYNAGNKKIRFLSDVSGGIEIARDIDEELFSQLKEHLSQGKLLAEFEHPAVKQVSGDAVLEANVDVLVPAALQNQLTEKNAKRIKAKLIVEGANGPTTPGGEEILLKAGKIIVPDIVANAGGVIVSWLEWLQNIQKEHWAEPNVEKRQEQMMVASFALTKEVAEKDNISLREASLNLAMLRVAEALVAGDEELRAELNGEKIHTVETGIMFTDTFHQLNVIVNEGRRRLNDLIVQSEEQIKNDMDNLVDEVIENIESGKTGAVLIGGPLFVGKAMFSEVLARRLNERERSAKVLHLEDHDPRDLWRLLNGAHIGMNHVDRAYSFEKKEGGVLELNPGDILIIAGDAAFNEDIVTALQGRKMPMYKVALDITPTMTLDAQYPFTSLDARMLREIMDSLLTTGKLPAQALLTFTDQRNDSQKRIYPLLRIADRTFDLYVPYELPILKRHVEPYLWKEEASLKKELANMSKMREDNAEMIKLRTELQRAYDQIVHLLNILEPVQVPNTRVSIPDTAIIRQFMDGAVDQSMLGMTDEKATELLQDLKLPVSTKDLVNAILALESSDKRDQPDVRKLIDAGREKAAERKRQLHPVALAMMRASQADLEGYRQKFKSEINEFREFQRLEKDTADSAMLTQEQEDSIAQVLRDNGIDNPPTIKAVLKNLGDRLTTGEINDEGSLIGFFQWYLANWNNPDWAKGIALAVEPILYDYSKELAVATSGASADRSMLDQEEESGSSMLVLTPSQENRIRQLLVDNEFSDVEKLLKDIKLLALEWHSLSDYTLEIFLRMHAPRIKKGDALTRIKNKIVGIIEGQLPVDVSSAGLMLSGQGDSSMLALTHDQERLIFQLLSENGFGEHGIRAILEEVDQRVAEEEIHVQYSLMNFLRYFPSGSKEPEVLMAIRDQIMEIIDGQAPVAVLDAAEEPVGGIDLNPELYDLQIKRDGNGVPLPLPQQPIETMNIEGFCPILINVTPIPNLPMLIGFTDEDMDNGQEKPAQTVFNPGLDHLYRNEYFYKEEMLA